MTALGVLPQARHKPKQSATDNGGFLRVSEEQLYVAKKTCVGQLPSVQNRTYRGEATHKGDVYPGEHAAIVDKSLWGAVQAVLAENRIQRVSGANSKAPSLLTGLLFDAAGERLTPTWSVKKGTRYRYYVSTSLVKGAARSQSTRRRIPAGNLESVVIEKLRKFLSSRGELLDAIDGDSLGKGEQAHLIQRGSQIADELGQTPDQNKATVKALVRRIEVGSDSVKVDLSQGRLIALLSSDSE